MPTTPELTDRFRRQGAMIMCVVAFPWAATGIGVLGASTGYWAALAASAVVTVALAVYSIRHTPRRRRDRRIPPDWRRRYNIALLAELVLIGVTVAVLVVAGIAPLIPAIVAIVVGIHFLPLATAFDQPQYRLTAAGLTTAGVLGGVLFLTADPALCGTVAGIGTAAVLWWTSLAVTRAG